MQMRHTKLNMDCPKRGQLTLEYADALVEWTKAGGLDPMKARDAAVVAARKRIDDAASNLIDHHNEHGC